jgi:xylan alpha-glucuronosyltransferase
MNIFPFVSCESDRFSSCLNYSQQTSIYRLDSRTSLSKRDYMSSYYGKDAKYRPFSALLPEGWSGKVLYVKLVLVLLMCGSFMGLLHSPSIRPADEQQHAQ